jgi:cyclase
VKGVKFVDLVDAGDPVEIAARYDAQGADELCFLDITASHEARDTIIDVVRRTGRARVHAAHVGGGIRTVEDVRRLLRAGATRCRSTPRRWRGPISFREASTGLRGAMRGRGDRCAPSGRERSRTRVGGIHRMAAHRDGSSMRSTGRRGWRRRAPARSCSPAWIATARRKATTWSSTRACAAWGIPVIASGGAGRSRNLGRRAAGCEAASAALVASIFHIGTHTVGEAKAFLAETRHRREASVRMIHLAARNAGKCTRARCRVAARLFRAKPDAGDAGARQSAGAMHGRSGCCRRSWARWARSGRCSPGF